MFHFIHLRFVRPLLARLSRPSSLRPVDVAASSQTVAALDSTIWVLSNVAIRSSLACHSGSVRPDGKMRCCNLAAQYRAIIIAAVRNCDDIRCTSCTYICTACESSKGPLVTGPSCVIRTCCTHFRYIGFLYYSTVETSRAPRILLLLN